MPPRHGASPPPPPRPGAGTPPPPRPGAGTPPAPSPGASPPPATPPPPRPASDPPSQPPPDPSRVASAESWRTPSMFVACAALLVSVIALLPAWRSAGTRDSQPKTGANAGERLGPLEATAVRRGCNGLLQGE